MTTRHLLPIAALLAGSSLAQSGVQSDDFNSTELSPIWSFVDPAGDVTVGLQGFGTEDAQLRFDLPAGPSHNLWWDKNLAPRLLQSTANTDLSLEAKFDSEVMERFQMQGIVVQESVNTLLRFEIYSDTGGEIHIYAARINETSAKKKLNVVVPVAPNRIRVQRVGDQWTMSTSSDGITFVEAVSFQSVLTVTQVGVHAGNHFETGSGTSPAFVALVDYFFNVNAPIDDDGPVDTEAPMADAGAPQQVHPGDLVTLDGSQSADDWTAPENLSFQWMLIDRPAGSAAELSGADTASPTLLIDELGDYVAELVVTDEAGLVSEPATAVVSSLNQAPTADAGADEVVGVGEPVVFDGLGSFDPDGDNLSYSWTLVGVPSGSCAVLVGADTASPSLTPDVDGDYLVELVVNDSYADSVADTVTATAGDPFGAAIAMLRDASRTLRYAPWSDFRRWYFKFFMRRQLRLAAWDIQCENTKMAAARIGYLLHRSDGCTLRGTPDEWSWWSSNRPDWIVDCGLQSELYGTLTEVLDLIQ